MSQDTVLGEPFNTPFYAILLTVVAKISGMKPRLLVQNINNSHIYSNHFDAVNELLFERPVLSQEAADLVQFEFKGDSIEDLCNYDNYVLIGHTQAPKLNSKTEVAI